MSTPFLKQNDVYNQFQCMYIDFSQLIISNIASRYHLRWLLRTYLFQWRRTAKLRTIEIPSWITQLFIKVLNSDDLWLFTNYFYEIYFILTNQCWQRTFFWFSAKLLPNKSLSQGAIEEINSFVINILPR